MFFNSFFSCGAVKMSREGLEKRLFSFIKKKKVVHLRKIITSFPEDLKEILETLNKMKEKNIIEEDFHGGYRFFYVIKEENVDLEREERGGTNEEESTERTVAT